MKTVNDVHGSLFELVFNIQIEMKKIIKQADKNLSYMEILILRVLAEQGKMTQQEIGQKLSKDKSQITRLVKQLDNKKLIIKNRDKTDKRIYLVSVKPSVQTKMKEFIRYEENLVKMMLKGITGKQLDSLKCSLSMMNKNITG